MEINKAYLWSLLYKIEHHNEQIIHAEYRAEIASKATAEIAILVKKALAEVNNTYKREPNGN